MPPPRLAAAPLALLLLFAAAAGARPLLRLEAEAPLVPTSGAAATGSFSLTSTLRRGGTERVAVTVRVRDVDVTGGASGDLPDFRAFLVSADGLVTTEVGILRVSRHARAALRTRDIAARFPLGIASVRDFEGGTFEVRRDGATVLGAAVPTLSLHGAGRAFATERVFGALEGVDRPRKGPGDFLLETTTSDTGARRNVVSVVSSGLPTDPNAAGTLPDYRVYLRNATLTRTVDLGSMRRQLRFGAWLRLDSRLAPLPGGIATLDEFSGGRIEVRLGGTILLRGFVPPFRGVDEPGIAQRSARARGREELVATAEGGRARGVLRAGCAVSEGRRVERLALRVVGLAPESGPYRVTAVHVSGTRTELGTFTTRGPLGTGVLAHSTKAGAGLSGVGVTWLGGQTVEVRDAGGTLVLTAVFPEIALD